MILEGQDPGTGGPSAQRARERIRRFTCTRQNVVFEGERGVGKRYHAFLLHEDTSDAPHGNFIEFTPDTPNDVLRAILFDEDRKLLEGKSGRPLPSLAGRSTLYLHDGDEFSFMAQVMLSRFLIEQDQRPSPPTRVILGTTLPWPQLLKRLADSFARNVVTFELFRIPPLRERLDELPSLVWEFLVDFRPGENVATWKVPEEMLRQLRNLPWRDNVRELKYRIEEAAITASHDTLLMPASVVDEIELVQEVVRTLQAGKRLAIDHSLATLEKAVVVRALMECGYDTRRTARLLEMTEPNLNYRIRKFNIYIPSPRENGKVP